MQVINVIWGFGFNAGSMSDKEIFRLSGITNLLTPDMAIMVDKGFLIENVAPCKVRIDQGIGLSYCFQI